MKWNFYILLLLCSISFHESMEAQVIKVTLLGTGTPVPAMNRFGPATLIEAGGQYFLFDCGRGAAQRLWQQKVQLGKVNKLFLTHLHSDHTVGIPDLWLTGWIPGAFGNRRTAFEIWGPNGTAQMMAGLKTAYSWDIKTRSSMENKGADTGIMVNSHNISEGVVYEKDGVKITAFIVDHADLIDSALGYRLDYKGHSVVISGDTRYNENLIRHSKNVDVLIHEVVGIKDELLQKSPLARQVVNLHTTPEQAGKIFSITQPRLAVYSHILIPLIDPSIAPPTVDDMITQTRKSYQGPLKAGEDLMVIEIGDAIDVKEFKAN